MYKLNTAIANSIFNPPVEIERNKLTHSNQKESNFTEEAFVFKNEVFEIKSSPPHNGYEDQYQFIQQKNLYRGEDAFISSRNISGDWFSTVDGPELLSNSEPEDRMNSVREIFQDNNDIIELGKKIEISMSELASLLDDRIHENEIFSLEKKIFEEKELENENVLISHDSCAISATSNQTEETTICPEKETTEGNEVGKDYYDSGASKSLHNVTQGIKILSSKETTLEGSVPEEVTIMCPSNSGKSTVPDKTENHHSGVPVVTKWERNFVRIDKSDMCLYCGKYVTNFSRHLERKHSSEPEVLKFQSMIPGSGERKRIIQFLRKKGNFLASRHRGIKLARRSSKVISAVDVLPCLYCNGFYQKKYLRQHRKICWLRPRTDIDSEKIYVTPKVQCMASKCRESVFVNQLNSDGEKLIMKFDKISLLVKSEPLILSFASFYTKKKKNCVNTNIKAKLRELGRFWYELKKHIEENKFYDALKPENFQYFIISIKNICGYNSCTGKFHKSPSLAIHIATSLKLLCDHAISETKQNNKIFTAHIDRFRKVNMIRKLKEMIICRWRTEIKIERTINPSLVDLTSDIVKLNEYIKEKANYCACLLEKEKGKKKEKAFNELQKCCLGLLMISNERRLNEVEKIELKSYIQTHKEAGNFSLDYQKILLHKYRKILINGEQNKLVPVLISTSLQEYFKLLLEYRKLIIPSDNNFLFAATAKQTSLNGFICLKTLAKQCGITFPQVLTNDKFQRHIAYISQMFNLDEGEIEQLCSSLGYIESTHLDYYRIVPYEIHRIATLLKLLPKCQIDDLYDEIHSEGEVEIHPETNEEQHSEDEKVISKIQEQVHDKEGRDSHSVEKDEFCLEKLGSTKYPVRLESIKSFDHSEGLLLRRKHPKIRWTEEQKEATTKYFGTHIQKKKPPVASEIMIFKKEHPFMDNKTWQQIKAFVYNIYRKM